MKFSGTVERNIDRGKQIEVKFAEGSIMKLTPPEHLALYINDKKTSVRNLSRGDQLTFYVPEGQFTAHLAEDAQPTTQLVAVPTVTQSAMAESEPERTASLPATASNQPLLLLAGIVVLALAVTLTLVRVRRHGH